MEKINLSQILIKGAILQVEKISASNKTITKFIDDTKKKQEEVLKLKEVNYENLKMVVQL